MKSFLPREALRKFFLLQIAVLSTWSVFSQSAEVLKGGSMESADKTYWTMSYTGMVDNPTIEFGSNKTCSKGSGGSLRISSPGTEYANIIIYQEVTLKANTVYKASGAIKDLTNGALQNFWVQLKLKFGQFATPPTGENDGNKLMGFNSWLFCNPIDGTFEENACDGNYLVKDSNGSIIGHNGILTPSDYGPEFKACFAIVAGIWTNANPMPYEFVLDNISLVDSVLASKTAVTEIRSSKTMSMTIGPNSAKGQTIITYKIGQKSTINLSVYNILGKKIANIYHGRQEAGTHSSVFNTMDMNDKILLVRLDSDQGYLIRKVILTD